ncbi:Mastermind-like protein 2 [Galemys pyrenaicus]|uniref:Mastermind-like protein 2 n=1 Tax=Galemys pyrenaicus TaxID=202257 RepID=A0A8J6AD35_GALPY|nr:Mastermind-like protein 2 [Galemys pyrenaicus]
MLWLRPDPSCRALASGGGSADKLASTLANLSFLAGGSSAASLQSSQTLPNPVSTHSILPPSPSLLSAPHGSRGPAPAPHVGLFGGLPCGQPGAYSAPAGMGPAPQQRSPGQPLANQSSALVPRPPALGPGASTATFAAGAAQQLRPTLAHGLASLPAPRAPSIMATPSTSAPGWVSQEAAAKQQDALKPAAGRFPTGAPAAYTPRQPPQPQPAASLQFPQRPAAPPNASAPALQMRPGTQLSQTADGQALGPQLLASVGQSGAGLSQARTGLSQPPPGLPPGSFPFPGLGSRALQGADHGGDLAFDFLGHEADALGPALSSDADFIDSLLKAEPGSDDWMKDINLDEILGSGS